MTQYVQEELRAVAVSSRDTSTLEYWYIGRGHERQGDRLGRTKRQGREAYFGSPRRVLFVWGVVSMTVGAGVIAFALPNLLPN